jgi:uncharacterized protein (UPF0332 family)
MAFIDKVAENKRVAEKCMEINAYNAGVTRAYYSAFLRIKGYLKDKAFDYEGFLRKKGLNDRIFSHGTLQLAIVTCLMNNGKNLLDIYELKSLDDLYKRRRIADYEQVNIIEDELKTSLKELDRILAIVV